MMQIEFEKMIGKRVSFETFKTYEAMYLNAPESMTKQEFVRLLDIDAIPEDPRAIAARQEAEKIRQDKREEVNELKQKIAEADAARQGYRASAAEWKRYGDRGMVQYYKNMISAQIKKIKSYKIFIKELKYIYNI